MNAEKIFNKIIYDIENAVTDSSLKHDQVAIQVSRENGLTPRDLSVVMNFLTGDSLNDYIKKRRMMLSYKYLIEQTRRDIPGALVIAGFDNQSSYTKRFSEVFYMPPGEAYKKKDMSLYVDAYTWSSLSTKTEQGESLQNGETQMKEDKVFGVGQQEYERICEAMELASVYGFERHFAEFAFEFSYANNIPLVLSFRYADSLREAGMGCLCEADPIGEKSEWESIICLKEELWESANDQFFKCMFFGHGISVLGAMDIRDTQISEKKILTTDGAILAAYLKSDMEITFDYFVRAYQYFMDKANVEYCENALNEYWDRIGVGMHFEEAFDCISVLVEDWDDGETYFGEEIDKQYEDLEKWAVEETVWNEERFDREYDPDNYEYEKDDEYNPGLLDY